ncbi:MAG: PorT family protein [Bacteroidales bacterium]|nr:PorT family protein [Bacteroidales bacterium]
MKKIILTTIFALFLVLSVSAQDNKVGFGLKAGMNTAMEYGEDGTTDPRTGIHGGIFVEIPVARIVDIQPELVYSMQGCGGRSGTDKFDYINLPIIVKIYVNQARSFSIDFGPQVGYMIHDNINSNKLNKVDAAVCFGATYKITKNIHANLRLNYGVLKIADGYDNRNAVGQLGLSYKF